MDGFDDCDFEFVGNFRYEVRDLFYEMIDVGFVFGFKKCGDGEGSDGVVVV